MSSTRWFSGTPGLGASYATAGYAQYLPAAVFFVPIAGEYR
jgi:hypothetical protein